MDLHLPVRADVTLTPADLDAARRHHGSAHHCDLCPFAQALVRTLSVPLVKVGFRGAEVYDTGATVGLYVSRSDRRASYRFQGDGIDELIMAFDAGEFDAVARRLPFSFSIHLVA